MPGQGEEAGTGAPGPLREAAWGQRGGTSHQRGLCCGRDTRVCLCASPRQPWICTDGLFLCPGARAGRGSVLSLWAQVSFPFPTKRKSPGASARGERQAREFPDTPPLCPGRACAARGRPACWVRERERRPRDQKPGREAPSLCHTRTHTRYMRTCTHARAHAHTCTHVHTPLTGAARDADTHSQCRGDVTSPMGSNAG